ncbi:hypothetical protein [Streptomyces montanisoli]|uniref:Uncharacterized protein n=1 Tax=Streptomyces montanisoli TaxID=2798581 RepID=A0A940RW38_9ACTN|nr:hypothetical protein [Streptomyces montanisoli]MBP0459727.1 hypothetical protein [Streptomyces montanisoli]
MSDGFFLWYRTTWSGQEAAGLLTTLDACGLRTTNPGSGRVSLISNGPGSYGEQAFTTKAELLQRMAATADATGTVDEVNFQLWADADADVFTRVRRLPGGVTSLEFGLDGLDGEQLKHSVAALLRTLDTYRDGTLGFVLDRQGEGEELDWDAVLTGAAARIAPLPDTLGLHRAYVPLHPELAMAEAKPVEYGDLLVFNLR